MAIKVKLFYTSFVLILFVFLSCKSKISNNEKKMISIETTINKKNKQSSIIDSTLVETKNTNENGKKESKLKKIEIFYVDSVLINGKVPLNTTYDFFIKNLGEQDSIKPFTGEMYSAFEGTETKSLYKNNSEYELYKEELIYYNIELNQQTYITYRGNKFTHKTTLNDFEVLFPNSVYNSDEIDIYNKGLRTMIRMRVSDNIEIDERINFLFNNNHLESFHWWIP